MVDNRAALVDRLDTSRKQFEKQYILKALERTRDNKTEAAKLLGLSRKALWEKCKRYGISKGANGGNVGAEEGRASRRPSPLEGEGRVRGVRGTGSPSEACLSR